MTYSDEELLKLDPELEQIFKTQGWPKVRIPAREFVPLARKGFNAASRKYNESAFAKQSLGAAFDSPTWTETEHKIPVRDNNTIKVRTYVPNVRDGQGVPVVVQMHGGGWFMGDLDTDALICRLFCAQLGVAVVDVDYRLYPDVGFGVSVLDCYDAVMWVAANASSFSGDPAKGFILSGNSGGGTYAAIAAHLARDDNLSLGITGCFLTCPIFTDVVGDTVIGDPNDRNNTTLFDHKTEYRSWWQNADAPLMNDKMRQGIATFVDYQFRSPLLTPFHFPSHASIPPTYICVCGKDPWRDGGVLYKRELEKVGGIAKIDVYPGLPHCWWTSYPQITRTQSWLRNTINGMQWLLSQPRENRLGSKI